MTVDITESTGYNLLVEIVVIDLVGIETRFKLKHIRSSLRFLMKLQFLNRTYLHTSPILLENCVVISITESRCRQLK